ncbi:TOBE domain-containing protein [Zavarzinia compransoris]|uniref:TOBE domain-containing protein n=1 Tax=Zavarzinia marina TaxID=2911065 RepID=UPI001F2AF46E|nr:TOBE domain-containing protein [Zavarzinia marina]MCF4164825.1 TOBE domain-containing protein [Zavarzinia marina]
MKTSARNQFAGTVRALTLGPVNAEVLLEVADGVTIAAIITRRSAEALDLAEGKPATALIKATFVILAKEGEIGKTSARNTLSGTIVRRIDGVVSTEYGLDVGGGLTLTAVVTKGSAEGLVLDVGDRAVALVKAPHIIIAVE